MTWPFKPPPWYFWQLTLFYLIYSTFEYNNINRLMLVPQGFFTKFEIEFLQFLYNKSENIYIIYKNQI